MLTVDRIRAGYGASEVLFDVTLSVGAGQIVTLLGRNGMGKTTTVNTIMGLLPVTAGSVTFDGQDIT
ncbi:MAG: ATP-binding cassette domain-containing protein, partial [Pseudomonadota bacterium]